MQELRELRALPALVVAAALVEEAIDLVEEDDAGAKGRKESSKRGKRRRIPIGRIIGHTNGL